jgi:hypothetical protein
MTNVVAIATDSGTFVAARTGVHMSVLFVSDAIGVDITVASVPFVPFTAHISDRTIAGACGAKFSEEDARNVVDMIEDVRISAIFLRPKLLVVSVGLRLILLEVPSLTEIARFGVRIIAESIRASRDGAMLAIFDNSGTLQFFAVADGRVVGSMRKEVWNMAWAQDSSSLFASSPSTTSSPRTRSDVFPTSPPSATSSSSASIFYV